MSPSSANERTGPPTGWCHVGDQHTCIVEPEAKRVYRGAFYDPSTMLGADEAAHLAPLLEFAAHRDH